MRLDKKLIFCCGLRWAFLIVCLNLFGSTVIFTFQDYLNGAILMTTTETVLEEGLYLPNVAVCSKHPYQNVDLYMFNLGGYKNNTYDPRMYIDRVDENKEMTGSQRNGTLKWTETEIYTYKYGRCMLYEFKSKVGFVLKCFFTYLKLSKQP